MEILFYISSVLLIALVFAVLIRKPRQDRDWVTEHSVLAEAKISSNKITLKNIISADYTAKNKCTVLYYNKTFDINDVESLWLLIENFNVYAGPIKINLSHAFLTFGFKDESYISISVAGRRKKGERMTFARVLPHKNEIIYKVINEADTILERCMYSKNNVNLHKLRTTPHVSQKILLSMLDELNNLCKKPKWFDTLTCNCCTEIIRHLKLAGFKLPMWHISYINTAGLGALLQKFGVIKAGSNITPKVQSLWKDTALSKKIRG